MCTPRCRFSLFSSVMNSGCLFWNCPCEPDQPPDSFFRVNPVEFERLFRSANDGVCPLQYRKE